MLSTNYSLLLPVDKSDNPDQRFNQSLDRICKELGSETISQLLEFSSRSERLQKSYSRQGLDLALAFYREAIYLDRHHRFDDDNRCGFKSKVLRKQAQAVLERIGFLRSNAHKMVATAHWMTSRHSGTGELEWFRHLSPSHLYELSRMSDEAYEQTKKEVSYPDFSFSAGQQKISVRRLEQIRRLYPKMQLEVQDIPDNSEVIDAGTSALPRSGCHVPKLSSPLVRMQEVSVNDDTYKLQKLIDLANAIDWVSIQSCEVAQKMLAAIPAELEIKIQL